MPQKRPAELPDEMFLIEVEDPASGIRLQTLNADRSPVMLLSFAANQVTEAASRYLKKSLDLGAVDWRLLFMFAREPGGTAAMASRTIGIDKGAVSRSLQRLQSIGLLTPGELHTNGRSRGWTLTPQGRRIHQQVLAFALDRHHELLAGFDEGEVAAFCSYLDRFQRNLDALIAAGDPPPPSERRVGASRAGRRGRGGA